MGMGISRYVYYVLREVALSSFCFVRDEKYRRRGAVEAEVGVNGAENKNNPARTSDAVGWGSSNTSSVSGRQHTHTADRQARRRNDADEGYKTDNYQQNRGERGNQPSD